MTAKKTSRRLALLAAVLSLLMLLSFAVIPGFAEETQAPTEEITEEVAAPSDAESGEAVDPTEENSGESAEEPTEAVTGEAATGETTNETDTSVKETSTSAATSAPTTNTNNGGWNKEDTYRLVINLVMGAVIVIVLVALAIVFRKKIPGFVKALKSECGKIVWCPKDKLKKNTIVVLVIILALAAVIAILDFAFLTGYPLLRDLVQWLIP